MSLATAPIEDAILAQLKTMAQDVYDNEVEDAKHLRKAPDGTILPYMNVYFGGPREAAGGRGIVNSSLNTNIAYCTVQINGVRMGDVRRVKDIVLNKMVGFFPHTDAGQISLEGSVTYRKASTTTLPTLYIYEIAFSYYCNLITG